MGKIEKNLEFENFFEIFFEDLGLFSNLYSLQEVGKNEKNLKFPFQKKKISCDIEIGPWFWFLIPKPGVGRTLHGSALTQPL